MLNRKIVLVVCVCILSLFSLPLRADVFGGVTFPGGAASFADAVVDYSPVIKNGEPTLPYRNPVLALGIPDDPGGSGTGFASLGDGGSITLRFTDNSLTGSGTNALDLWIFEVGPDVEDTYVEISANGATWLPVGKVFGATSGIDIDAFGYGLGQYFSFVRLTDDSNEGGQSGATVGADIDAVGAISSAPPVQVPEPASVLLVGLGLMAAALKRRW